MTSEARCAPSQSDVVFSGEVVCRVAELRQRRTYEGLLEGVPTLRMNDRIIARAIDEARTAFQLPVEALRPVHQPIKLSGVYRFGQPARIPEVTVLARFQCRQFARNRDADFSALAVVWFQKDFAFPIDDHILDLIAGIDWRESAKDFEW